tara:strand:+ start:13432 stop:13866 length:435 start_codon:yes stop_codon:yes gene_type:complete
MRRILVFWVPVNDDIETTFEVKIIRNAATGIVKAEHWSLDGKGESPPGDRPSTTFYDDQGRPKMLIWKKNGLEHRENGPAHVVLDPVTGVHVQEHYVENGRCHRDGRLPAQIYRDATTGEVTKLRYWVDGKEKFWRKFPTTPSL